MESCKMISKRISNIRCISILARYVSLVDVETIRKNALLPHLLDVFVFIEQLPAGQCSHLIAKMFFELVCMLTGLCYVYMLASFLDFQWINPLTCCV